MTDTNSQAIERFWADIAPWETAYSHAGLSFVAVRRNGQLHLLHGRLFLHTAPPKIQRVPFDSASIAAGYFPLAELGLTHRALVDRITRSEPIDTPLGPVVLPTGSEAGYSVHMTPFHAEGISSQSRLSVLLISGAQRHDYLPQPQIDWEMKSATRPYESLNELLNEYSLGIYRGDFANLEVVALAVANVDYL